MKKKRMSRRKRIVIAYTLRGVVVCVLAVMIFLMICGCLYLRDWFIGKKGEAKAESVYAAGNEQIQEKHLSNLKEENTNFTIVLDAGHGGNDSGTSAGKVTEKEVTFSVVQKMQKLLEEKGASVILTRDSDEYVSLKNRVSLANQSAADLFVSIHCNYFEKDSSVYGLECYYAEASENGKKYAENLIDGVKQNENIAVRSAKPGNYWVLKKTEMPSVLVELGYFSNSNECQKLVSTEYQEELAKELVEGIVKGGMYE